MRMKTRVMYSFLSQTLFLSQVLIRQASKRLEVHSIGEETYNFKPAMEVKVTTSTSVHQDAFGDIASLCTECA